MGTTTTLNQNQTILPQWYSDYLQQVMGQGVAASQQPYQAYTGPTVAALTPDQQQAYSEVQAMQGGQTGTLKNALDLYNQAGATNSGAAGAGSLGQAANQFGQAANANLTGLYAPYAQQSAGLTYGAGAQAQPLIQQSTQPTGLAAASPFLSAASQSTPSGIGAYMNPYNSAVTDTIAQLGAQNLSQNLLPTISNQFIQAGQYGSPQQRSVIGRAIQDTQNSILQQQSQALQSGYNQATQAEQADLARQAQLAGTAGGLGTSQQQLTQSAGTALGNLGLGQASQISNVGSTLGALGGQNASLQLGAGQGYAGIGNSQIQAAQSDAANRLQAASGINGLATNAQNLGLQQAAALESAGAAQQANTQASYNAAQSQFQQQQQYPWTQIGNLSNIVQGLPINSSSTSSQTTNTSAPSPLSQVAGVGLGVAGLANSGLFKAKGGAVRARQVKYKRSHSYGNTPRRGIDFMDAA